MRNRTWKKTVKTHTDIETDRQRDEYKEIQIKRERRRGRETDIRGDRVIEGET